ncbi:hypothetical protein HS7_05310 [Sulfolobales archaeon HS-7]|nr:hypothetical protein HS7_05310 [Sulfolobales archaeon HS-7]
MLSKSTKPVDLNNISVNSASFETSKKIKGYSEMKKMAAVSLSEPVPIFVIIPATIVITYVRVLFEERRNLLTGIPLQPRAFQPYIELGGSSSFLSTEIF